MFQDRPYQPRRWPGLFAALTAAALAALCLIYARPLYRENDRLSAENAALRAQLAAAALTAADTRLQDAAAQLRAMYPGCRFVPLRAAAQDVTGALWAVARQELPAQGAVVDGAGCLVGTVQTSLGRAALIRPLTAREFAAACWVGDSYECALLAGDGQRCLVTGLPRNTALTEGAPVLTSGLGGVVPGGLYVGQLGPVSPAPSAASCTAPLSAAGQLRGGALYLVTEETA